MVQSHLSYLAVVYGTSITQGELQKLQVAQNVAVRKFFAWEYYVERVSTQEIFKKYDLLNVEQNIHLNEIITHYKIINGIIKIERTLPTVSESHEHFTRNRSQTRLNLYRTNVGKKSILNVCAERYNTIDRSIAQTRPFAKFKKSLKKSIIDSSIQNQ